MKATLRASLILILSAIQSGALAQIYTTERASQRSTVAAHGEAVVQVRPDIAVISLGVETKDLQIAKAKSSNAAIMDATIKMLQESGIAPTSIKTDHLSIEPVYRNSNNWEDEVVAYVVRQAIVVTFDEPERVDAIVTAALETGVNRIHGINFQTANPRKYRDQARELALVAAKEKADAMAATYGQSLGQAINITEGHSYDHWYSSWTGWGYSRGGSGMHHNVSVGASTISSDTEGSIALGEISIRAKVHVVFELLAGKPETGAE